MRHPGDMNRGGYTLVEMVITMVIVGVLAFVFIPRSYVDNSRAGAAGRKLLADLRYAQQLSTTTQLRSGIVILAGSYSVFTNNTSASTATDPLTGNPFIVNMTGNFAGVTLTAPGINNGIIRFDSLGIPYQGLDGGQTLLGAAETINIFSGAALIKTITIQPTTGQITIN